MYEYVRAALAGPHQVSASQQSSTGRYLNDRGAVERVRVERTVGGIGDDGRNGELLMREVV